MVGMIKKANRVYLLLYLCIFSDHAVSQISNDKIIARANAALSLMSFSVVPDVTTSTLSIDQNNPESSDLMMTQLGGGATISEDVPIYLEGTLAFSRFDPTFVITSGNVTGTLPLKWNSLSASGGVGWDFKLDENLVLRPIVNVSLGRVVSDIKIARWYVNNQSDLDLSFIDGGSLNAYGYGGSIMLDYELFSERQDIDAELRYSYIRLNSFGSTASGARGQANAENLSLYLRRRAPTGYELLNKPLRYVLEGAHTQFLGEQRGALGFDYMSSAGVGLELDSSDYDIFITRTRLVLRYMFGQNSDGYALGLAMSF
ncbi:autotransporter domain-containing protein [Motilimonas sp. 1_MG-2023]|uniref:autotransporter domain-containing protein n=2 Tax=unclassified Motilimonas TaxID=2643697 RepID=UPI0026E3689F|nr:autotransporter domain-containing protein [Motilimonas sp. 1_MG-2023]MDO6525795.1 autotransporter domain-containing protein [Motilimonas sp. 1_MG-2023]